MKCRSLWPIWILKSNVLSYRLAIQKNRVYISNLIQDIKQNHWTMKYRSLTYVNFKIKLQVILTHNQKVWYLYLKYSSGYKAHPLDDENSSEYKAKLLDHEILVMLTFTSWPISEFHKLCDVWPNNFLSYFHNRKVEKKKRFTGFLDFDL